MSASDDEDDFLSADEEGFVDDDKPKTLIRKDSVPDLKRVEQATRHLGEKASRTKPLNDEEVINKVESSSEDQKKQDNKRNDDSKGKVVVDDYDDVDKTRASHGFTNMKKDTYKVNVEDDEEAVLERVRERNLRIARKFSAEIAKNIKASAPIPIRGGADPIDFEIDDIGYSNNSESGSVPSPPPPTPALSSSFNSEKPSTSGTTQYGWRVPSVQRSKHSEISTPELGKSEQTSLVLDRLAEKFSQNDKNLFEKIVDDVKKVSIKSEDAPGGHQASSVGGLITELGHPFSNWTWSWGSEAGSKLLASASQVTTQVGSVLDSVVNVSSQPFSQQPDNSQVDESAQKNIEQKDEGDDGSTTRDKSTMGASEAASNDALVDFTLNAMESLGKKAFSVMTERDESGSLQIKGLGRPWENLMSARTARRPVQRKDSSAEAEFEPDLEPAEFSSTSDDRNTIKSCSDEQVTLKNRKKRFNRDE